MGKLDGQFLEFWTEKLESTNHVGYKNRFRDKNVQSKMLSYLPPEAKEKFKDVRYVNDNQFIRKYIETMFTYSEQRLKRSLAKKRHKSVDVFKNIA